MAFSFFGGVHPDGNKWYAKDKKIQDFPEPDILVIPMGQHIGAPCKPLVKKGDLVKITGTKYYSGKAIPAWVKAKNWYVLQADGARVVIDRSEDGRNAICSPVNAADLQLVTAKPGKTVDELAREVIRGLWGNGIDRRNRLTAAGYSYDAVQKRVNELLR